jgi:tartrate dehydrogenase/decarboxylase/D-malate dehydrogenase
MLAFMKGAVMKVHKIAVLAGDGIGKEVMPEDTRAVEAAARRFNFAIEWTTFEWPSCDYYLQHGKMMPDDWMALQGFDALFFGAVGWPETVPDHVAVGIAAAVPPQV